MGETDGAADATEAGVAAILILTLLAEMRVAPAVEGVALVCLSLIDAEHAAACRRQLQRVTGERDDD